jgi:methyl-galactoside transport system substrate-binding protein
VEQWDAPGEAFAKPASPKARPASAIRRIGAFLDNLKKQWYNAQTKLAIWSQLFERRGYKMRKIIALSLAVLLLCGAAACGGTGSGGATTAGSAGASSDAVKIGSVVYKFDDTFMSSMRTAMQAQAQEKGVTIDIQDGQNDQTKENDIVSTQVTQGVTVLAINPVKADIIDPVLASAKNANLPIVFFNKQPSDAVMNSYDKAYYVGARAEDSGTMMGEILAEYFKANPDADKNGDGKVQFVLLTGENNHQDAVARSKYSQKALQDAGLIDGFDIDAWTQASPANDYMLGNQICEWDTSKALDTMNTFITSLGLDRIEAVIANNDDMGLGAIQALQANGYNKGDASKYIPVVAVDATDKGKAAIKDGSLLGTVLNDAVNQGKAVVNLSVAASRGEAVSKDTVGYDITDGKYIWIPYSKVTLDNVDTV